MSTLTFYGAAQRVTGSCYLIHRGAQRILLECGMLQGENNHKPKGKRDRTNGHDSAEARFPFEVGEIDAVILSHAHLDHSGMLPLLVKQGYRGPIYMTQQTEALLPTMHKDAAFLQLKDTEWENKRRARAGKRAITPLYDVEDVEQELGQCQGLAYGAVSEILPGVKLSFREAGHILGSAIVELWLEDKGETRKLVFSGDLGNSKAPLMRDPAIITEADLLLMESTYGDRNHQPLDRTLEEFRAALDAAAQSGGNVLIPSFAVGRTQDLIYYLGQLYQSGQLKQNNIFIDSPMATSISEIYEQNTRLFNKDDPEFREIMTHDWEQWLPILRFTRSVEESMALNKITGGAIIIAGSGMCHGGRIRHHLKYNLWRKNTHLVIVGFQARGTLGRLLVDGVKKVKILGSEIAVKAHIHTLGGFSAHAGQSQLLEWAGHMRKVMPRLYLVHGESEAMLALQKCFVEEYNWDASIPTLGEVIQF
ncbi:MBL fold metallo-hydrolase RNA specificity domain-containing protein [Sedimenticola sp.]|uniref:MBL fold metallo-hydrolase RNA specificity domain-containing protein n=1 Tax=Sedimenticola sp. TaxID=1940285 RepID=UPI003D1445E3